jgi:hypothetical protein
MRINKKPIYFFLVAVASLAGCTKQHGFGPDYSDYNSSSTPVIVSNAVDYRPDPTVTTSLSGDSSITMTLTLSGSSGRTIKQITEVIASSSYAAIQNPNSKFYNSAPIAATNNSVTFTTSIAEYFQHYPASAANPAAKANVELANHFYFEITLDDGTIVYPTPVRVLVLQ